MASRLVFVSSILLVLFWAVSGSAAFHDSNPILMVSDSDRLRELEAEVVRVVGQTRHALRFASFAHRYGKSYNTAEEMKLRYGIFLESLELIESTNRKGLSYKLGVNQFADWTWEEFQKRRLGDPQHCDATTLRNHELTDMLLLPESKDWRDDGIVSPVKDQGDCGSSWAFSTTGALEAAYKQAFGKNISLSEQQLVDCANDFNNFGCNGGLPSQAFEYIKYNGGIQTDASYPYTAKEGGCKFQAQNVAVRVMRSFNITQGDENELLVAVGIVRPVSVGFEVDGYFRLYKEGVYSSQTCGSDPQDLNYAGLAVGFGVEDGVSYWLIQNSWGESWGDHGYIKLERGKNMCGVATCASFPMVV